MCADFLNQINSASDAWLTMPELRAIEDHDKRISSSTGRSRSASTARRPQDRHRRRQSPDRLLDRRSITCSGRDLGAAGRTGRGLATTAWRSEQTVRDAFSSGTTSLASTPTHQRAGHRMSRFWKPKVLAPPAHKISIRANPPPQRNVSQTCENFAQLLSAIPQVSSHTTVIPTITALLNARSPRAKRDTSVVKPL